MEQDNQGTEIVQSAALNFWLSMLARTPALLARPGLDAACQRDQDRLRPPSLPGGVLSPHNRYPARAWLNRCPNAPRASFAFSGTYTASGAPSDTGQCNWPVMLRLRRMLEPTYAAARLALHPSALSRWNNLYISATFVRFLAPSHAALSGPSWRSSPGVPVLSANSSIAPKLSAALGLLERRSQQCAWASLGRIKAMENRASARSGELWLGLRSTEQLHKIVWNGCSPESHSREDPRSDKAEMLLFQNQNLVLSLTTIHCQTYPWHHRDLASPCCSPFAIHPGILTTQYATPTAQATSSPHHSLRRQLVGSCLMVWHPART